MRKEAALLRISTAIDQIRDQFIADYLSLVRNSKSSQINYCEKIFITMFGKQGADIAKNILGQVRPRTSSN